MLLERKESFYLKIIMRPLEDTSQAKMDVRKQWKTCYIAKGKININLEIYAQAILQGSVQNKDIWK